jgi:VanZ family protein
MSDPFRIFSIPSWLRWLAWGVFLVAWSAALLTPQPVYLAKRLLPEQTQFPLGKTLHVGAYAVLTLLTSWLCVSRRWRWGLLALVSLHGMATEGVQLLVPDRTGTLRDVGLNHLGILLGFMLSWRAWWLP